MSATPGTIFAAVFCTTLAASTFGWAMEPAQSVAASLVLALAVMGWCAGMDESTRPAEEPKR